MSMRNLFAVVVVAALYVVGCGGDVSDRDGLDERARSPLKASQIWTSSTPVLQGGQPVYCGGYTYTLRIPVRQYLAAPGQYASGLQGTPSQALDSSRGEFGIWCGNDNLVTNFENALASSGPQVCYAYSHRAGETAWAYDGAVSMPASGIYYAPKGSYNPGTGVYYSDGFWRLTFASYASPPDGNGRVLACFVSYGLVTVDLY